MSGVVGCGLLRKLKPWAMAGQSIVAKATGIARITLYPEGLRQVSDQGPYPQERIRNPGGGRKKLTEQEPTMLSALEALVAVQK